MHVLEKQGVAGLVERGVLVFHEGGPVPVVGELAVDDGQGIVLLAAALVEEEGHGVLAAAARAGDEDRAGVKFEGFYGGQSRFQGRTQGIENPLADHGPLVHTQEA